MRQRGDNQTNEIFMPCIVILSALFLKKIDNIFIPYIASCVNEKNKKIMKRSKSYIFSQPKDDKTTCFAVVYENGVPCGMRSGAVEKTARTERSVLAVDLWCANAKLSCAVNCSVYSVQTVKSAAKRSMIAAKTSFVSGGV